MTVLPFLPCLWGFGTVHWQVVSFNDLWLKLAREVPRGAPTPAPREQEDWPVLWQYWESIMLMVANECTLGNCSPHSRAIFSHLHIDGRRTVAALIRLCWNTLEMDFYLLSTLLLSFLHLLFSLIFALQRNCMENGLLKWFCLRIVVISDSIYCVLDILWCHLVTLQQTWNDKMGPK